jgi:hypothetical protein
MNAMPQEDTRNTVTDAGALSRDRRYRRVAWTPGSIEPYTSTWIVVQRFILLNRPSPQSFEADFVLNDGSGTAMSLDCAINPGRSLRLSRFCRVTGEAAESLKWSQVGQYPPSLQPLFGRFVVWCRACLAESFHSVLYSLCGLKRCPVHDLPLEYRCRCGLAIPHGKLGSSFRTPGCCRCGFVFLKSAAARDPKHNPARDVMLGELTCWLETAASRFWFDLHDQWSRYPSIERYLIHAQHWAQASRAPEPPASWAIAELPQLRCERWACSSHEFGGEPGPVRHDTAPMSEFDAASAVFKAIKRHLLRHVLDGEARWWIEAFARSSDEMYILRHLTTNPRAQDAWCLLLWWQSCVWSVGLRDWFRRRAYRMPPQWEGKDPRAFPPERPLHPLDMAFQGSSRRWLLNWTTAGSLLMLWVAARKAVALAVANAEPVWGRGAVGERVFPAWSAARNSAGNLALCMDAPNATCWSPRTRTDKGARVQRAHEQACQRRLQTASQCASICAWYDAESQTWAAGLGIGLAATNDARKLRLFGETPCLFVISALRGLDGARFAAQSLAHPVAASARSPRGAINGLRTALARWTDDGRRMRGGPIARKWEP